MEQITTTVVAAKALTKEVFKLTLFAPGIAGSAQPGQFIHLQCGEDRSFILRRPFSIHQVVGVDTIDILIKVVGQGTSWLSQREPKDTINAIGPLGRGFVIDPGIDRAILVGGGVGVAPMVFLARALFEVNTRSFTLMGAATASDLLDAMELKRVTRRVSVATDDGSRGYHGLVTDILAAEIEKADPQIVYACGPEGMLRNVAGICARYEVDCQVSLEARMACGVGACLGCAVETTDGYVNVCSEGPVFSTRTLGWGRG